MNGMGLAKMSSIQSIVCGGYGQEEIIAKVSKPELVKMVLTRVKLLRIKVELGPRLNISKETPLAAKKQD